MRKSLSFYAAFYFLSLVAMRGAGILAKIVLARSITPFEYGLITLFVISLPGLLQDFTNFCFYDIMGHATEGKKYLGFSLLYGMVSTVVIGGIIFIFRAPFFTFLNVPPEYWTLLFIVLILSLIAVTLGSVIAGFLRGVRNHAVAASFSAAPSILRVVFVACAVYVFSISDFPIILLLFALPPLVVLLPVCIFKIRALAGSLKAIALPSRNLMMFGFAFFILNVWVAISQQINSIVISHDLGIEWQGYYDVSLSLVAVITFFSSAVYLISAPERTTAEGATEVLHRKGGLGDVGRMLFSLCLLFVVIFCFYSRQLITLLFTARYAVAADFLYILAIGYAVLFVQQYVAFLNISKDESFSLLSLITVVSIAMLPVFTHLMIVTFGFLGAYIASTVFIGIYTALTIILAKDRSPLYLLFAKGERLLFSLVVTIMVIWLVPLPLVAGIFLSIVVFVVLVIGSGYLDKNMIMDVLGLNKAP